MRIYKKTLFLAVVFILLLIVTIGMAVYIFIPSPYITVLDKSEQYNISYKDKKEFEEYLKKIGAFEKNNVTLLGGNNMFTLKKINIVLTDINNGRYSELYPNKETLASVNINGSKEDGILTFAIYISPKEKSKSTDDLSNIGLFQVLIGLRTTIGTKSMTTQEVLDIAQKDIRALHESLPFLITPQSNK